MIKEAAKILLDLQDREDKDEVCPSCGTQGLSETEGWLECLCGYSSLIDKSGENYD